MIKRLNIVGMGQGGSLAPFEKEECWGINHSFIHGKLDKLFIAHTFDDFMYEIIHGNRLVSGWYKKLIEIPEIVTKIPLYLHKDKQGRIIWSNKKQKTDINNVLMDLKGISEILALNYASSTLCYLLGEAALKEYEEIVLWGFTFNRPDSEYKHQFGNVKLWIKTIMEIYGVKKVTII